MAFATRGVSIVFKNSNKKHIDDILDTENFELSEEDWGKLAKESPVQLGTVPQMSILKCFSALPV